jgi:hypothetical protein
MLRPWLALCVMVASKLSHGTISIISILNRLQTTLMHDDSPYYYKKQLRSTELEKFEVHEKNSSKEKNAAKNAQCST